MFQVDGENDRVLILWPVTIAHKIDSDSPLYDMNPRDILSSQFEVVLTLEGVTEETGNTIQVKLLTITATVLLPSFLPFVEEFEFDAFFWKAFNFRLDAFVHPDKTIF